MLILACAGITAAAIASAMAPQKHTVAKISSALRNCRTRSRVINVMNLARVIPPSRWTRARYTNKGTKKNWTPAPAPHPRENAKERGLEGGLRVPHKKLNRGKPIFSREKRGW